MPNSEYYQKHKAKIKQQCIQWANAHKNERKEYMKKWREENKEWMGDYHKKYYKTHKNNKYQSDRTLRRKLRLEAYRTIADFHGHEIKCWRCGEDREWVLTIGHINDNGKDDRREYGTHHNPFFKAIISGERSSMNLEIECVNCNYCKEWYGKYPDEFTPEKFDGYYNSPPEHADKTVRVTKQEAEAKKEHFDGNTTEQ